MKKIVALLLCVALAFCFAACGKEQGTETKDNSVLIEAIDSGKIPEMDIAVGQAVDTVEVKEEHSHQDEEVPGYSFVEAGEHPYFLNQTAFAYYNSSKKSSGIAAVLSIKEAFGFQCNSFVTPDEIKSTFSGTEFIEEKVDSTDMTIMPFMMESTEKLVFKKDSREIRFYITDDQLIAVCMIDTAIW